MRIERMARIAALLICAWAAAPRAIALNGNSFTGSFANDTDQREFFLNLTSAGSVIIRTWSYAGGINAAGTTISRGGFDPTLSLYDSNGVAVAINQDGGCALVAADAVTSSCWDAYLSLSLPAGAYRLVMTQSTNLPAGPNISDSFIYNPNNLMGNGNLVNNVPASPFGAQTNFTQPPGAAAAGFWDFFPSQRTSSYALDITGATSVVAPAITTSSTLPFGFGGVAYTPLTLTVQSGSGVVYTWLPRAAGLPPGMSLSSAGILSGTPAAAGSFTFIAIATDGVQPVQRTETINIYNPVSISTLSLPPGVQGSAYGPVVLTASGGSGSVTWTSAGVPAGLSLNSAGVLSGTTPASVPTFSVTVTDTVTGQNVTRFFSISVSAPTPVPTPPAALQISGGGALPEIIAGGSASSQFGATGGTPPYSFGSTVLPGTLTLAPAGILTGVVAIPGNYSFTVRVTDSGGQSSSVPTSISVMGFTSSSLPPASTLSPYSFSFGVAGGTQSYSFSASGVPAGLSLSSGGVLTGTPKAPGSSNMTVRVTDGVVTASVVTTLVVTGPVPGPLSVTGGALNPGQIKSGYLSSLTATGGSAPYKWSQTGGSLPDGVFLGSDGSVSGTPSVPGSFSFAAQATDALGSVASGTFSIVITPATLTITSGNSLPNGIVGSDYPLQIFSATGGTAPYVFNVAGSLPAGLTFANGQIGGIPTVAILSSSVLTVTDAAGKTASVSLSILINPAQVDLILSDTFLNFSVTTGSIALPEGNDVTVRSSAVQQLLNYSYAVTPAVPWLSVNGGNLTPGSLAVALTNAALAQSAGNYQASIVITCIAPSPCAGHSQTVAVSFSVTAPAPQLTVTNTLLSFSSVTANPIPLSAPVGIQNSGGGSLVINSITAADEWVSVTGAPATVAAGPAVPVTVTVSPAGLPLGYNHSSITVNSLAGQMTVPVALYVSNQNLMSLSPGAAQFSLAAGGSLSPGAGSFQVSVFAGQSIGWSASVLPGAPWLTTAVVSGSSGSANAGAVTYSVDPALAAQLPVGTSFGTIRVTSPDVTDSPLDFVVSVNVAGASALPVPNPTPSGIIFQSGSLGGQTVSLYASSAANVPYQASASTFDGANWLSVSPATGTTSAAAPASSTVSVNTTGLPNGVYAGLVSYALSAAAVRSVNVTLLVTAAGGVVFTDTTTTSACAPTSVVATHIGLVDNFSLPATVPAPLKVLVSDNCGHLLSNAQVNVIFSNGDAPLLLSALDSVSGIYTGVWAPLGVSDQVSLTAAAAITGLSSGSARINGEVVAHSGPVLTRNAVLSVYNPLIGGAVAPGAILQIYGANLATAPLTSSTVPLTNSLGGTSVSIGGVPAPLYYVSPSQINAQTPFGLSPGNQYQVVINAGGALTMPASVTVVPNEPGIAGTNAGQIIAQHLDGTLVSSASPAKPGTYVIFYLAGLGATDIPVPDGLGSPVSPIAHPLVAPMLTLAGAVQPYQFVGLTPGLVGLYQINFLVPAGTPEGNLSLAVSQSGVLSNQVILPVQK